MGDSIGDALASAMARLEGSLATDADVERWERARARDLRSELLAHSGALEVLSQAGADAIVSDTPRESSALRLVRQWLASSRPVLALFGGVGVGKTVAASWALARMPGRYVRADVLTRMRRGNFGAPEADYARHLRCELLVIDELGIEENAEHATATLYDALDCRQRLPRRTLLLGNLDAATLAERYEPRVLSRLREVAVIRSVKGEDMRGAA